MDYTELLAKEFSLRPQQVRAAVELLDAGNTIPFIARYRKEATGSLDDQVLRELAERLEYLRGLDKRRDEIRKSLTEQDVWTEDLEAQLDAAKTLSELEDIYRPFRPKRRTRATVAKERGLEPLALWLMMQVPGDPEKEGILIGDLTGFVFRAIVDDDDFNVFSERDEGVDGVVQVFLAVIGRDAHCY